MSVNPDKIKNRRISSILKKGNDAAEGDNTTETFNRVSKRISFSTTKNVKEFKVGESNATIWGQSLEVSATSSDKEDVFQPSTDVISLFADIQHKLDDEAMDVEMVDSNQQRQSVIQKSSLKQVDQTMLMNETCDITYINKTMFGSTMKLENMSPAGTNKRKSIPNTSVDNSISLSPIEKHRKINEIEMGRTPDPDNNFTETMVMEIDDNRALNLDQTRIWDADLSTNESSNDILSVNNHRTNLFLGESLSSNPLNKTSTTVINIVADDHSIMSFLQQSRTPKSANQTHIFEHEDVNARIDQTILTRNLLEEHNFSQFSTIECHSSSLSNSDEYIENNASKAKDVQSSDAVRQSMLTNTVSRIVNQNAEELLSPIIRNESLFTDDFTSVQTRDHCPEPSVLYEQQLVSPTLLRIRSESILTNDNIVNRRSEHGSDLLEALEKDCRGRQRSPTSCHAKSGLTLMQTDVVSEVKHHGQDCLKVLEKPARHGVQRSPTHHAKSNPTLDKQPSPTFHHVNSTTHHAEFGSILEVQRSPTQHTKSNSNLEKQRSPSPKQRRRSDDRVQIAKVREVSNLLLPSIDYVGQNLEGKPITPEKYSEFKNRGNTSSFPLNKSPNVPGVIDYHQNVSSTKSFDNSINAWEDGDICDVSLVNYHPLSSTNIFAKKSMTPNITNEIKMMQTSLVFNSSSPMLRKSHLGASFYNNTDELCNLEPEQLRKVDTKLDIANDMLSETKLELVDDSKTEESKSNTGIEKKESQMNIRCQKCSNCRKSIDGNLSLLKIEDLKELQLDFSGYEQFKGLATYRDVIAARKKRKEAKDLAKQSLMDQNVPYPGWEILWENKQAELMLLPQPEYEPMLLTIFPMRMSIQFLLENKLRTEYTKWKYFDNYFFIGAVALRHEKIPSIRIHIKFDRHRPERAQQLSIPLAFNRVFVEECPYYLKNISARTYLKHKHGLAMLPLNLTAMFSDSEHIYNALDQFDEWFGSVVVKVNELMEITIECEAFLKMWGSDCYIEKTVFDIKNYLIQKFIIKLDKIDKVGWRNVSFDPDCKTTDEFKSLPLGLPFLRTFLRNPKSFLLQKCIDGGIS